MFYPEPSISGGRGLVKAKMKAELSACSDMSSPGLWNPWPQPLAKWMLQDCALILGGFSFGRAKEFASVRTRHAGLKVDG